MDDIPIESLMEYGLKRRHVLTLMKAGVKTIGDLAKQYSNHDDPITAIIKLPRCGGAIAWHTWKAYTEFLKNRKEVKV